MGEDKKLQAYTLIKKKIIEGEIPPLADISEEQLEQELGISRTPIRQALHRLSEEGFLNIYPRKGTIVTDISMDLIFWLYEVRELTEPYITRKACGKIPEAWLREMRENFLSIREKEATESVAEARRFAIEMDNKLHECIIKTNRNQMLTKFLENIYDHSHRLRIQTSFANREYNYSIEEHLAIVDALLENDPDKAEAAARKHLEEAKQIAFKYNI